MVRRISQPLQPFLPSMLESLYIAGIAAVGAERTLPAQPCMFAVVLTCIDGMFLFVKAPQDCLSKICGPEMGS